MAKDNAQQNEGTDSAEKSVEEGREQTRESLAAEAFGGPQPKVKLNHGEPDPRLERQLDALKEAEKDPWGNTPVQMRDVHHEAVDPANREVAYPGQGPSGPPAVSGLSPDVANEGRPDEEKVSGTLPPV